MIKKYRNDYLKLINRLSVSKIFLCVWVAVFILFSYILDDYFSSRINYYTYIFEWIFVVISFVVFWQEFKFKIEASKRIIFEYFVCFLLGGAVYYYTVNVIQATVPYDFSTLSSILMLIFLGPLIEELVFRFSLWEPIDKFFKNKWITIVGTSTFFSMGHLYSIFLVPKVLHEFIYFQSFYTFVIGLWWGYKYVQHKNFLVPLVFHILFNAGFYFGFYFMTLN